MNEPHFEALNFVMDFFLMKLPENIGVYRLLKVKISKKSDKSCIFSMKYKNDINLSDT